ncbi:hypothetical protein WME73_42910 [Sorangium sp. So ce302]|uniref:hypothetical protein n=1 Tax=unclassified Sorangium TaxID=2621164 RepID=UPI003F6320F8
MLVCKAALFDSWGDYLAALGLPDHGLDLPRATQTNALMLAAFERLGIRRQLRERVQHRRGVLSSAGK